MFRGLGHCGASRDLRRLLLWRLFWILGFPPLPVTHGMQQAAGRTRYSACVSKSEECLVHSWDTLDKVPSNFSGDCVFICTPGVSSYLVLLMRVGEFELYLAMCS